MRHFALQTQQEWDALSAKVPSDAGKRELAQLKKQIDDVRESFAKMNAQGAEPIDWAKYKAELPDPKIVDIFEKAVKSFKAPELKVDIASREKEFAAFAADADKLVASSKARIEELEKELAKIRDELKKVTTVTIEEALEADPALKEKIDGEIQEGKWY